MDFRSTLFEKIRRADRSGAAALLDAWVAQNGTGHLLPDLLEPVLLRIGEEWRDSESCTLAQAYMAGRVAEDALTLVAERHRSESGPPPVKGPVVIGNIEDDYHSLGRRMVGTFLRAEGWVVHDLGNDVPPAAFVDKAQEVGARVVGASAMMLTNARNIRKLRAEIDGRGLAGRIQLAVGGAVFLVHPDLVGETGGDGTAPNAIAAVRLFDRLWERSAGMEAGA